MALNGCVQWLTGDYRVYKGCIQGLTGGAQGMTGKTQGKTGGFSYGQEFSEPVVKIKFNLRYFD